MEYLGHWPLSWKAGKQGPLGATWQVMIHMIQLFFAWGYRGQRYSSCWISAGLTLPKTTPDLPAPSPSLPYTDLAELQLHSSFVLFLEGKNMKHSLDLDSLQSTGEKRPRALPTPMLNPSQRTSCNLQPKPSPPKARQEFLLDASAAGVSLPATLTLASNLLK